MALADAAKSAPGPDLARLRIERSGGSRRRRISPWLVILVLLLGAGAWAYSTGRLSFSTAKEGRTVRVAHIARPAGGGAPAAGEVKANGYVIARRRAARSTVLSGRLVEVNVEEGDTGKAGQVVARIQHDDIDASLASAQRAVAVAEAKRDEAGKSVEASRLEVARLDADNRALAEAVKQAEAEVERTDADVARKEKLRAIDAISQDEFERSRAGAQSARAVRDAAKAKVASGEAARVAWDGEIARRVAAQATAVAEVGKAQQSLHEAEILLEKTYVRAPFDGLVVHKDAEVGEVVAATGAGGNSRGSVATIVDPETLEAQIEMSETRLGKIGEGDPARIKIDAEGASAPGYTARVRQVWPTADRQKATVELRVEFVEKPAVVKTEMGVTVSFLPKGSGAEAGTKPEPVRAPKAAIVSRAGKPSVAVVSGGIARWVAVEKGAEKDGLVEVVSGLVGGETVVLDPPTDLEDGANVKTEEGK